jgi:hypothetical protein
MNSKECYYLFQVKKKNTNKKEIDIEQGIRLFLNGNEQITYLRQDGKFVFYNLTTGSHVLEIDSPSQIFVQVLNFFLKFQRLELM